MLVYYWKYTYCTEKTEASAVICKEASQEVHADRTKCVYMYCVQNAGQNHNVKVGNKSCLNVVKFIYLGRTLKNKNYIREQTKKKWTLGMRDMVRSRIFCVPFAVQNYKD